MVEIMDGTNMKHLSENELNTYLDDMLAETERQGLEAHLAACPACQERFRDLQLVFESLAALPQARLSRDLTPAVLSQLPPRRLLFARSRSIAIQLGAVLGVSVWSAMQLVQAVRLPSLDLLLRFLWVRLPEVSLQTLGLPAFRLPPLELPALSPPAIGVQFTSVEAAVVILSAFLLGVVGNLTLLRRRAQASS